MTDQKFKTKSEEETFQIGVDLGRKLRKGDIVLLSGELGAGKTVFTKGIAKGIGIENHHEVHSPTFTIVHEVKGNLPLIHFDLYRLNSAEELFEIGFDEYLERDAVVVIEWGNKFENYIPRKHYLITIEHLGEHERSISIQEKQ